MVDLIIIGAGPAGLTAAIYARRSGLSVQVIDKFAYGGQVALTSEVENYPGVPNTNGAELSAIFYKQAQDAGAEFVSAEINRVELEGNIKKVFTRSRKEFESRAVIVANGVRRRKIGCPGEATFSGRGVSYCATCDGAFYKERTVAVVGGGNTAIEDALYLSAICKKVYVIHRRDTFRAEKYIVDALGRKENVSYILNATVSEISGANTVESVSCQTQDGILDIAVDAVFVAIGTLPDNEIYAQQIKLDQSGYFKSGEDCKTNVPGVFVAGDCRVKPIKQIVTATADGAVAATFAAEYVHARV